MDEQTPGYFDAKNGLQCTSVVFQLQLANVGVQRGTDGVTANLSGQGFNCIQPIQGNSAYAVSGVLNTEQHRAAPAVGECGQFVGQIPPTGVGDPAALKHHLLELQSGVLTKPDTSEKMVSVCQCVSPVVGMESRVEGHCDS